MLGGLLGDARGMGGAEAWSGRPTEVRGTGQRGPEGGKAGGHQGSSGTKPLLAERQLRPPDLGGPDRRAG